MPRTFTKWTLFLAYASVISQAGIIITGAAVRLTGSGLGCSEWPRCSPDSYVATPELGIHGFIEFGNRTLTFVLTAIAVFTLLAVWNLRKSHRQIFGLSVALLAGIPAQAVLGGITVLTGLNPWIVSSHYLLSAVMVIMATMLLNRVRLELRYQDNELTDPRLVDGKTTAVSRGLAWGIFVLGAIAVVLGTVVTGSGPHGGDEAAARHDYFDQLLVTRLHAFPVYIMTALAIILAILVHRMAASQAQRRSVTWVIVIIIVQAGIGFYQHFMSLPIGGVLLHMVGSGFTLWSMTNLWDRQRSGYVASLSEAAAAEQQQQRQLAESVTA